MCAIIIVDKQKSLDNMFFCAAQGQKRPHILPSLQLA